MKRTLCGEKNETNIVHSKTSTVPVNKPNRSVVLSDRGQGGENVIARYTRSGNDNDNDFIFI